MRYRNLNEEDVIEFHEAAAREGNAFIATRADLDQVFNILQAGETFAGACLLAGVPELEILFKVLDQLGVSKYLDFLANTAITIPLPDKGLISNLIYVPWDIGEGNAEQLARQVIVLSHELTHCFEEDWLVRYLTDFDERTMIEKRGFHTSMEVDAWLFERAPRPDRHLGRIDSYYLMPTNIKVLRKALDDLVDPIIDGAWYNPATKFCIRFFEEKWGS